MLGGFSDGHSINGSQETSCIYRKGFLWFLSCTLMEVQKVQEVQGVQIRPIRPIRLIRGKTEEPILWRTALQAPERL